jgi:flavin-dependent dehydrogenase
VTSTRRWSRPRRGAQSVPARAEALDWDGERPVVVARGERRAFDFVLAADGARGVCRRTLAGALGEALAPQGESVGLGASLDGVEHGEMVLAFPGVADAYAWIFPRPGGVSVGLAYSVELLSDGAARGLLAAFLGRHLRGSAAAPPPPRYRYPIPVWGPWTLPAVEAALGRRVLLLGDAAALADPLTREGIRYAVRSGRWAAESLLHGRPESYPERLAAGLGGELSRARRALGPFYDGPLGEWMVPAARLHPGIRTVLGDLLAGRQSYRGLRRRLLRAALGGTALA